MLRIVVFPIRPSDRWECCAHRGDLSARVEHNVLIPGAITGVLLIQSFILVYVPGLVSAQKGVTVPNGTFRSRIRHRRRATILKVAYKPGDFLTFRTGIISFIHPFPHRGERQLLIDQDLTIGIRWGLWAFSHILDKPGENVTVLRASLPPWTVESCPTVKRVFIGCIYLPSLIPGLYVHHATVHGLYVHLSDTWEVCTPLGHLVGMYTSPMLPGWVCIPLPCYPGGYSPPC